MEGQQPSEEFAENVLAMLRDISQRQTMLFHLVREIYEETRLPIKLVREVGEDEYLARHQARPRNLSIREEDGAQAETGVNLGIEGMGDPERIPFVPAATIVTCVRCGYVWMPRIPRPSSCAKCNSPWWYAPRWRWHMNDEKTRKPGSVEKE